LHILQYKQVDKRAVNTSVSKINRTIGTKFHRSRMKYKRIRHCSQHASKRTCSRLSSNSTRCRSDCSRRFIRANWSKTSAPRQQQISPHDCNVLTFNTDAHMKIYNQCQIQLQATCSGTSSDSNSSRHRYILHIEFTAKCAPKSPHIHLAGHPNGRIFLLFASLT